METNNMFSQDMEPGEMFKTLVDQNLQKADVNYSNDDHYLRVRSGVVNYYKQGKYKEAWLDLANFLANKKSNLSELANQNILRILAEQENPVLTKADILNLTKK